MAQQPAQFRGRLLKGWPAVFYLIAQYARLVGGLYLALVLILQPLLWLGAGARRLADVELAARGG